MENVKLCFYGTEQSQSDEVYLEAYANAHNDIFIQITNLDLREHICLNKQTAIRLVKELKKQIGVINLNITTDGQR